MSRKHFSKGEMILGEVVEVLSSRDLILQVEGHLIRVKNASTKKATKGQAIELIVNSVDPLRFELAHRGSSRLHLNVSV
jgi:hypothetical protein